MDDSIVSSAYRGLPIVFLGPSIALDEARAIVNADFRPPCRRGDLAKVVGGAIIGLIDGVFDQNQAVSPREIVYALKRGVTIFGSSSMGALRAVEIPGMHGVGHIYEMYRKGIIDGDDEVALIFDPSRFVPLTVPLVNVRYAIERLLHSGSISASVSERILAAAKKLHYRDRTYKRILAEAKLDEKIDTEDLLNLLTRLDLKREDAKLLLERLADVQHLPTSRATPGAIDGAGTAPDYGPRDNFSSIKAPVEISVDAPVLIWEMGDAIPFAELVLFLKLTGRYMLHARNAIIRLLPQNQSAAFPIEVEPRRPQQNLEEVKRDFRRLCATWGWKTREEIQVTMSDLGLGLKDISTQLRDEGVMQRIALRLACNPTPAYMKALRCELFFNDMALKREAMRYASLKKLVGKETPSDEATDSAKRILCRLHCMPNWYQVQKHLIDMGAAKHEIQHFLEMITNARLMVEAQQPAISMADQNQKVGQAADEAFGLRSSPKAPGDQRFCLPLARAYEQVNRLKTLIGITRVGMIAGLTELEGVHISQAARPDGAWSSSYGSGKSDTKEGAVIGGIMEEVEKWAQERYKGEPIWTSYANLRGENALDPRMLDLPYDSIYEEHLEFAWEKCFDLIDGRAVFVPLAAVANPFNCGKNNIFYSQRGARVVFTTNGLASGFTLAEALVHAMCEYIERHATRMSELQVENPGLGFSPRRLMPRRIDNTTLSDDTRILTERFHRADYNVRVWDTTSEVRVPTFLAHIGKNGKIGRGWATHPNPGVATHMAILEAAQTVAGSVAAGREDLTVQARSLGRHERPIPLRATAQLFWEGEDGRATPLPEVEGMISNDAYTELTWIRQMIIRAGIKHIVAVNLSRDEIKPVHVVRVILPELETNNPYYCGQRARMALISDLLS